MWDTAVALEEWGGTEIDSTLSTMYTKRAYANVTADPYPLTLSRTTQIHGDWVKWRKKAGTKQLSESPRDRLLTMAATTTHPAFQQPANGDGTLWRYMDFTKYVDVLHTNSLFFSRADRFDDPFEGSYSRANKAMRPQVYKGVDKSLHEHLGRFSRWVRQWTLVQCWHMNDGESAAMWKLYAQSNEAVAIQSSYAKLVEVLPEDVFVGRVAYIDYEKDWLPEGNTFYPFLHKRKSFEHESEVRAIKQELPSEDDKLLADATNREPGLRVSVDVAQLVERVLVAPTAPDWFLEIVVGVTRKYGFGFPVVRSSLAAEPFY